MKQSVSTFLDGETRRLLHKISVENHVSVSGLIRGFVECGLKDVKVSDGVLHGLILNHELESLSVEDRRLMRSQVLILRNCSYLKDYVEDLVKGCYKNPAFVELRKSILSYPNAEKVLPAIEGILARRQQIGLRVAEIQTLLYPGLKYDLLSTFQQEYEKERRPTLRNAEPSGWSDPENQDVLRSWGKLHRQRKEEVKNQNGADT
jgi:hypothetical protein